MDLTDSITPRSDQINADDLLAGPITVTINEVTKGKAEPPFDFQLAEFPGRAYRPSKSMRRVIVVSWGPEASVYAGRQLTLFRNPEITFGKDKVGGIQISHLSHIAGPITLALTETRGKRRDFTVKPIETKPAAFDPNVNEWLELIESAQTQAQLRGVWEQIVGARLSAVPELIAAKDKRKAVIA